MNKSQLILSVTNPVVEKLIEVYYKTNADGEVVFNLFSLDGKQFLTEKVSQPEGNATFKTKAPKGIYLLEMQTKAGKKVAKVVVE